MKWILLNRISGCHFLLRGVASLFLLTLSFFRVEAQVITVKQDGTGDYTVIQEAVNASSNGDTVIVYPGIYYENVDITDKGIIIASAWIIYQNDSIIHQTIIDGNKQGSCIRSMSGDYWGEIIGFTLKNGTGTNFVQTHPEFYGSGGAIFLRYSKFQVAKCIIMNNFAFAGAGICALSSSLFLFGNIIAHNWATGPGGGIRSVNSVVVFDSLLLNNIFLNYSSWGSDIAVSYNDSLSVIYLDTGTIINPDSYYIGKFNQYMIIIDQPEISIINAMIEQADADLYVSPSGSDLNSGIAPGDPLKTISFALLKITSDSVNPNTIFVSDGIYSHSSLGDHLPLQLKNHVNLFGESRANTIIDCEEKYEGARFAFGQNLTHVKNLSLINGNGYPTGHYGGISSGYSNRIILDSIALINTTGNFRVAFSSDSDDTIIIKNSIFKECKGYKIVETYNIYNQLPNDLQFISNQFSFNQPDSNLDSKQISLAIEGAESVTDLVNAKIINCLFNDNVDSTPWAPWPGPVAIGTLFNCKLDIVNSTFAYNLTTNPWGGAVGAQYSSDINFYNCILYGNDPYQIYLVNNEANQADTVRVYHSLVQNGPDGIMNYGMFNQVLWGEGNLDDDPLFFGSGEHPYSIDYGSPCIDAGTLYLPPGITLPEYDIAGNLRIWGETVDMGAYEYGPWVGVKEDRRQKTEDRRNLDIAPNPFSYGTYISYEATEKGMLNISVYNISGMKVRTLINSFVSVGDKGNFYWDGSDENKNELSSGAYILRMTLDGKLTEAVKVVKIEN